MHVDGADNHQYIIICTVNDFSKEHAMNTRGNQRYKATELAIRQVVMAMLEDCTPAQLNVREICQRANINRSTFYLHFKDVYDMLDKFEADMSSEMVTAFTREGTRNIVEGFENMFEYVRTYASFYRAQLRNPARKHIFPFVLPADYAERVARMRDDIGPASDAQWRYQERFMLAGIAEVTRLWLDDGCLETPQQLTQMLFDVFRQPRGPWFNWSD